jgi:hyperosmotically inducible periplasmic protein
MPSNQTDQLRRIDNTRRRQFGTQPEFMKVIIIPFICICTFALASLAQQTNPDNSAKNQRDRSGESKTSGDQSNTKADTDVAAAVRRAIVKDGSLSMTAKNVKIISAGKTVTLRGPVNNAGEKAKIQQLAASAAPGAKIDNQLEIKAP